jgi:hypothetical protein
MATVLEDCIAEKQRSVVRFFTGKRTLRKEITKEMFPVFGGKCLSRKAFHRWVEKFSQERYAQPRCPVEIMAETKVKGLLCCGFRYPGKAMGQVYQC